MIDAVVCSKDRPHNLWDALEQINRLVPCDNILVYEGSINPPLDFHRDLARDFGAKFVYVPRLVFGAVRAKIMEESEADYVAMIDDDIVLSDNWVVTLMREFNDSGVVAVSCKLVYSHPLLKKMFLANSRISGGSGGAAIYDREAILRLGNFNKRIHRGEDMELELRIWAAGKKWVKCNGTYAFHPITLRQFLERPKGNVVGWDFIMKHNNHRLSFIAKRFGSALVMPVYYLWKTLDPRCAFLWAVYKLEALLYYLSGKYLDYS